MSSESGQKPETARKRRGATPLSALLAPTVGPVFSKRGFAGADLAVHWPEIVGAGVARHCRPLNLHWPKAGPETTTGATLTIACSPAFALDVQQMAPVILERLNRRLGWRCVTRLTLKQMPVRPPPPPRRRAEPDAADRAEAGRIVAGITSDDLKDALARLGAGALARVRQRKGHPL